MIISGSGRCFWAKNTLCLRDSFREGIHDTSRRASGDWYSGYAGRQPRRGDSELAIDLRLACPADRRGGRVVEALNLRGGSGPSIWSSVGVTDGLHKVDTGRIG